MSFVQTLVGPLTQESDRKDRATSKSSARNSYQSLERTLKGFADYAGQSFNLFQSRQYHDSVRNMKPSSRNVQPLASEVRTELAPN